MDERAASAVRDLALQLHARLDLWLAELAAQSPPPSSAEAFLDAVREVLGAPPDMRHRLLETPSGRALVLSLDRLVDDALLDRFVVQPLLAGAAREAGQGRAGSAGGTAPSRATAAPPAVRPVPGDGAPPLPVAQLERVATAGGAAQRLAVGQAVVFLEGSATAWAADVSAVEHRSPDEPDLEPSIRGDREGFIEVLRINLAALRRRVATPRLRVEELELGKVIRRKVAVVYLAGRADPRAVDEVRRRLASAPWDALYSSQQLETLLEDHKWSLFPQIRATERPDACVGALNEGRIVVMMEGTPFALIVPTFFWDLLQTPDDYHLRWVFASVLRGLRLAATFLVLAVLPAYVAITTFHQELVPSEFFLTLAAARQGVPVPTVVEAFSLNLAFDFLREASTRLPKQVGGALSIVGALVIGESAVRGGFVSAPVVILFALGALALFVLPAFATTIPFRALTYVMLLLAGTLGLFGLSFGLILVLAHMASLTTLGLPFLSPVAPFAPEAQEDVLVRLPYTVQQGPPPLVGTPSAQPEVSGK